MEIGELSNIDPRINYRYQHMVKEHININKTVSAGHKSLMSTNTSFASTQAAWRFYQNPKVTLNKLIGPLQDIAAQGVRQCNRYCLCIHDWSRLKYIGHKSKKDTYKITHEHDVGYSLQTSLLINDTDGLPITPIAQRIVNKDGSFATYYENDESQSIKNNLDELCCAIEAINLNTYAKPLVHIIDREADSILHLRRMNKDNNWLIRAKKTNIVDYQGKRQKLSEVAKQLNYTKAGKVNYKGKMHNRFIAEAPVIISRDAIPSQKKGYRPGVPGEALKLRLVVCRIQNSSGDILSEWYLLTNVSSEVPTDTICDWYYWRWRIESYFKLMKKGGYELESWRQCNALSILKRLLVVSMSCVFVWHIAQSKEKNDIAFRDFLVRLSGKQIKKNQTFTLESILTGLWMFLSMNAIFETYTDSELLQFKQTWENLFV